jgi:hypothetical protein
MYVNKLAVLVSKTEPVGVVLSACIDNVTAPILRQSIRRFFGTFGSRGMSVTKFTSDNERGLTALFGDMNGMGVQAVTVGPGQHGHVIERTIRTYKEGIRSAYHSAPYDILDCMWPHLIKLAPKLLGPYTVLKQVKNDITCRHVVTEKIHTFHSDRVTPFIGTTQDADKIGLLDREEFEVHSILQHKGNLRLVTTLTFLVRWEGYTSESDTWEPWAELKHLLPLHTYLRTIGHSNLIPSTDT